MFHLLRYSALPLRRACQTVLVTWNKAEKDERKQPQGDDKPNQRVLQLSCHLEDRGLVGPELGLVVKGEDQRDEYKRDVGECQPKARAFRGAAEFNEQSS